MTTLDDVATKWLADPPWQKVFKHTFNVFEDYMSYVLISLGAVILSVRLFNGAGTGELACIMVGLANATTAGDVLPYASGAAFNMIFFAQDSEVCVANVYDAFNLHLPYIMLLETITLVVVEKFSFRTPRISQKLERFYTNIVEESLFGKDPDVAEDLADPKDSAEAISRSRQRNEICISLKRTSLIYRVYVGKNIAKCVMIVVYLFANVGFVCGGEELPTRCRLPLFDVLGLPGEGEDAAIWFQCKAKKLQLTVRGLWVQNYVLLVNLFLSAGCLVWCWKYRPVTNLIRKMEMVRKAGERPVVKAHYGKDFLFLFDLLGHSCGLTSTLRVLTHSDDRFFQICKPKFSADKNLVIAEDKLKVSWEPADIERWLHAGSKKKRKKDITGALRVDSYEVTLFPAETVNNTKNVPVDVEESGGKYYTWFFDLNGGRTEYVVTIACMVAKSRMKGAKVVTVLVPYGPEKPSSGVTKEADTNQVEIFWDPPRGDFTKYVLTIEKMTVDDLSTSAIAAASSGASLISSNLSLTSKIGDDGNVVRKVENLSRKLNTYTIHGLEPGERYRVQLVTKTATVTCLCPVSDVVVTRPLPVVSLQVESVTSNSCLIRWAPPPGHSCLKGFHLRVTSGGGSDGRHFREVTVAKTTGTFLVDEMSPGCDYDVFVTTLCYWRGARTVSDAATVPVSTLPEAPRNLRLESATTNSLLVRWDATTSLGNSRIRLSIEGVDVDYSAGVELADERQHCFSKLEGTGRLYKISVVVVARTTARDTEVQSVAITDLFATLPHKPTNMQLSATGSLMTWSASLTPHIAGYMVRWKRDEDDTDEEEEAFVTESKFELPKNRLTMDATYSVGIVAVVDLGEGDCVESKELQERVLWYMGERLVFG